MLVMPLRTSLDVKMCICNIALHKLSFLANCVDLLHNVFSFVALEPKENVTKVFLLFPVLILSISNQIYQWVTSFVTTYPVSNQNKILSKNVNVKEPLSPRVLCRVASFSNFLNIKYGLKLSYKSTVQFSKNPRNRDCYFKKPQADFVYKWYRHIKTSECFDGKQNKLFSKSGSFFAGSCCS